VAKLREQQHQLAIAKSIYLAVLDSLGPKQLSNDSTKVQSEEKDTGGKTGGLEKRKRGSESVWSGKPASRHVKGITEAMCRPVPANAVANQLKGEAFYRLACVILHDPSVTEAEKVKTEVAIWFLRVSLKIDGTQRDAHFKLGLLLLRALEFQNAVSCFSAVTMISPDWAQAWNNLGVAQDRAGHQVEAVRSFREAMKINPTLYCALCNTSMISLRALLVQKQPDAVELKASIGDLTKVIENSSAGDSFRSLALSLRGLAYQLRDETKRGIRDVDLAVENYLDAIDSDANNLQGRVGIVCIYLQRMDVGAAYPHLDWLIKTNPRSDIVGDMLVWSRKVHLVFEEPVANFLECIHMNPRFRNLSLSSANVNIQPLKEQDDLLNTLLFEAKTTATSELHNRPHKDGPRMSAYHYVRMACLCLSDGNIKRSIALGKLTALNAYL
jgi:tetratricopeptide (TPR) repeat protein